MRTALTFGLWIMAAALPGLPATAAPAADPTVAVGTGRVDISPREPVRLSGYVARKAESTGVAQPLWARAVAIGEGPATTVLVVADNVGIPLWITDELSDRLRRKAGLPAERFTLACTHTHSAPALDRAIPNIFAADLPPEQVSRIRAYTSRFIDAVEAAALAALSNRQPATLEWGQGSAAFAANRRTAGGPHDHALPVLVARGTNGLPLAILTTYACHCTTLGGEFNQAHADWAGCAAEGIERDHPGALALVAAGCGGDQNPAPRGTVELARRHGEELATAVRERLHRTLTPLPGAPACRFKQIDLPFDTPFTREQWEARAKQPAIVGYHARRNLGRLDRGEKLPRSLPYPVQTWTFGDRLAMVFLGGEVVVDYALRLKREFDSGRLWVTAYANDVPCYIPSRRILAEGGYEAEDSLWYYDQPARLAPSIEDQIVATVHELLPKSYAVDARRAGLPPPLEPDAALGRFVLPEDLQIDLAAAEPLIESPVAVDFDARGRLWVCEMRDYPAGLDGRGAAGGRIKVLTDTNHDGRFDRAEVFADGLPFPTGLMVWRDGVLVGAAPDVWFITREGRTRLVSGFAIHNFQARVNGLRPGLDGWVYGSGGLFGGRVTVPSTGRVVECSQRDFRFRPDTGEFEALAGVSQQGHVRDDFGEWFGNDNGSLLWHFPLPDHYARRNPAVAPPEPRVPVNREGSQVFPVSRTLERFNDPGSANHLTSACGPEIYRDDALGAGYAGDVFVCEPVHNLVRRGEFTPEGVSFAVRRAARESRSEFLASDDNWFRPVEVRTGPDGALWVVDMYRFVIEHPRWIPAERLQQLDVRAGADRGRIYRIRARGRPAGSWPAVSPGEAVPVGDLAAVNGVRRDLALLDLQWRRASGGAGPAAAALREVLGRASTAPARIQVCSALALDHALVASDLAMLARDPLPAARRAAARLAESVGLAPVAADRFATVAPLLAALAADPDPGVRFQTALSLGGFTDPGAGELLAGILARDAGDRWIRAAVLSSATPHWPVLLRRWLAANSGAAGPSTVVAGLAATALAATNGFAGLELVRAVLPPPGQPVRPGRLRDVQPVMEALSQRGTRLDDLVAGDPGLAGAVRELSRVARETLTGTDVSDELMVAAVGFLGGLRQGDPADGRLLLSQLSRSAAVRPAALAALRQPGLPDPARDILAGWETRPVAVRSELLALLLERPESTALLLDALEAGRVRRAELSAAQRQRLAVHPDATLRGRAHRWAGGERRDREAVLAAYQSVTNLPGDPARGMAQFDQRCASCHRWRGHGSAVGPDLASFRVKPVADFLVAVLDPNAAVDPRYGQYEVELVDGRSLAGLVQGETGGSLTVVQPGGNRETLLRSRVRSVRASSLSLMPEGLETGMTPRDMADLLAWLKTGPRGFGSASGAEAEAARQALTAEGWSEVELVSASERLRYPSWLGVLSLAHCRQTDGRSEVRWRARPVRREGDRAVFRFPGALGLASAPAGKFTLRIAGQPRLEFDVSLDDHEWLSGDGQVRLEYGVREVKPGLDSNGLFEISVPEPVPPAGLEFSVRGSAAGSQRWFGIYLKPAS